MGKKNGIPLYFTGSPTLNQRGQVRSFSIRGARRTALQIIDSEQVCCSWVMCATVYVFVFVYLLAIVTFATFHLR